MPEGSDPPLLFLRDLADVEPPRDRYAYYDEEDIYRLVPRPQWTGLDDEIWTPRSQEHDPQLEKVKALMKSNSQSGSDAPEKMNALSASKFATKLARKKRKNPRVKVRQFLNSRPFDSLINFAIIWALFSEDIRVLSLDKTADYFFWGFHVFFMLLFFIELLLRSYSQRGFAFSFYFTLDFLASGSMVFDWLPLVQGTVAGVGQQAFRAAKSARVGTRIARLVRVLRIIRVIKLFISARKKKDGKAEHEEVVEDEGAPSELSKALQGTLAKRTIVFVLVLLIGQVMIDFIPFAGIVDPPVDNRVQACMAQLYTAMYTTGPYNISAQPWMTMGPLMRDMMEEPLRLVSAWNQVSMTVFRIDVNNYGPDNDNYTFWPIHGCDTYPCSIDTSGYGADDPMTTWQPAWPYPDNHFPNCAWNDLGTLEAFNPEAYETNCPDTVGRRRNMRNMRIKGPIELLVEPFIVDGVSVIEVWYGKKQHEEVQAVFNMLLIFVIAILLAFMGFQLSKDVDSLVVRPIETMVGDVTKLAANPAYQLKKIDKVRYETDALRVSLAKIATMLQVGFGEAGNNLVAENLKKGDSVDPMVPGRKLLGAYGFCIIDEYEDVLEALGEEILPFTNTAATLVHEAVTSNGGQPNRNLGEAFLCVWKPHYGEDPSAAVDPSPAETMAAETKMCDGALTAFRRCVRTIAMSAQLQGYNKHEEIVKFFDGHYTTRIGYGLHYGWAIEGAVGTNIKIDCSYLSPNVNLAARLESATKMYGVNILMSESFYGKLSPAVQKGLRRVDVVCLKGSSIPMAIYTCDRSNGLYVATEAIKKYGEENVVQEFQSIFEEGMDGFVSGDWAAAKACFETALTICPRDKPSNRIMMHMDTPENHPDYGLATNPFVAPDGWPGYHILLSK